MKEIELLNKLLHEKFITDSAINAIKERLSISICEKIFYKYKNKIIKQNGLDYRLIKVKSHYFGSDSLSCEKTISLFMYYVCISDVKPSEKKKIEEQIEFVKSNGYFSKDSNHKFKLWNNLNYTLDVEKCLNDIINLSIEI